MSRPVERIEPTLALLRQAWYANPDWRLGQLIGNAARDPVRMNAVGNGEYRDPFNVEDDEIWQGLEDLVRDEHERITLLEDLLAESNARLALLEDSLHVFAEATAATSVLVGKLLGRDE